MQTSGTLWMGLLSLGITGRVDVKALVHRSWHVVGAWWISFFSLWLDLPPPYLHRLLVTPIWATQHLQFILVVKISNYCFLKFLSLKVAFTEYPQSNNQCTNTIKTWEPGMVSLEGQTWADLIEFKGSLVYIANSRATETLSQNRQITVKWILKFIMKTLSVLLV